jgi:hypothetical protein
VPFEEGRYFFTLLAGLSDSFSGSGINRDMLTPEHFALNSGKENDNLKPNFHFYQ